MCFIGALGRERTGRLFAYQSCLPIELPQFQRVQVYILYHPHLAMVSI